MTTIDEATSVGHRQPHVLPGDRGVLFAVEGRQERDHQVAVLDLATGDWHMLMAGSTPRYAETGHLVYALAGGLYAAPFNLATLTVTGAARLVVSEVLIKEATGDANYALSSSGTLAYAEAKSNAANHEVVWVTRNGQEETTGIPPGPYQSARLSPSDDRVALGTVNFWNIGVFDFARDTLDWLIREEGVNLEPRWSPDGDQLAFFSTKHGGISNLHLMRADRTGPVERLVPSENRQQWMSWASDGARAVFSEDGQLHVVSVEGDWVAQPFEIRGGEWEIAPGDRWIAYSTSESGQSVIEVRPFPNVNDSRRVVSPDGGTDPRWSPQGDELFYRDLTGRLMSVHVETETEWEHQTAQVVQEGSDVLSAFRAYDISRDGSRFLIVKRSQPELLNRTRIVMVRNWFDELQSLVPIP